MSSTNALPQNLKFTIDGFDVEAPARLTKLDPENPTKPQNVMYEAKRNIEITSGRQVEDILGASSVEYEGTVLKRGEVHLSKVNETRGTGGNVTVTHSLVADIGGERPYQFWVTLTGLRKEAGDVIRISVKGQLRPQPKAAASIGTVSAGAAF